jgi:hypothetical protein
MSHVDPSNFRVITQDDYGVSVRCSFCARGVPRVVVLPLTQRPELEDQLRASDGDALWVGLCAYCVLAMAKALAANSNGDA